MQKTEQEPQELLQIWHTWQEAMYKEMHKQNTEVNGSSLQPNKAAAPRLHTQ